MVRYCILVDKTLGWTSNNLKSSWSNFFEAELESKDEQQMDDALKKMGARDCSGSPYLEFETEYDLLVFELKYG